MPLFNPTAAATLPSVRTVTTTDTATTADSTLLLNGGGNFTETLYTPVGNSGRTLTIQKIDSVVATVYTISGTGLSTTLNTQGETIVVQSDGTNWFVLNRTIPTTYTAITPTFAGFGTVANNSSFWYRSGKFYIQYGSITTGTVAASLASVSFVSGATLDTSGISINNTTSNPGMIVGEYAEAGVASEFGTMVTAPASSTALAYFSGLTVNTTGLTPQNGSQVATSSQVFSYEFRVPISGWNG